MRKHLLLTAALLLTGCATSPQECDLHAQDPGFLTRLSCVTSGGYRHNVDMQEQQVRQSQRDNHYARQTLADTQNQQAASSQRLADEQASLTALRADLAQTLKRLQSGKVKNQQARQQIKHLQDLQQQALRADSDEDIAAIQQKVAEAREKVEALERANTLL
ncbi:hypothetical protein [Intestinirhabdus alba]|jgi:chromosome segregation ATPase|uniref:Lipoprotein n=1 Tax=Intestinirhabdus alba TaxID=2899544 RepID=A0A6L6IMG3_9ENTR|nr:hypothetical protein [Intestinirhabdus alba]MTH46260.1 hypothetical protein [Intestinirhabdus alba]